MPIAKQGCITGLIPDVHFPDHNRRAVAWARKELEKQGIHKLIILGDMVDVKSVSRFMKSLKDSASLPAELEGGRKHIAEWDSFAKGIPVVFLEGNHEARLSNYLRRNAPELADLPELVTRRLLGIPDEWEYVRYGDYHKEQGVLCQHGRKFSNNLCRSNAMTLGCSSVQGHSHRVSMVSHRFAGTGKQVVAVELGCLCNFNPGYAKLTDWCHACGWITDGNIHVATRGARV